MNQQHPSTEVRTEQAPASLNLGTLANPLRTRLVAGLPVPASPLKR